MNRELTSSGIPPRRPRGGLIAVDTGGTFTDAVAWLDGRVSVAKVPSTPADPAAAVATAVEQLLAGRDLADLLVHGSTVATNALLERRGARVVLVTSRGFEDVLAIGRQNRPQLYALTGSRAEPLVPSSRRIGVAGRLGPRGDELERIGGEDVEAAVRAAAALQPEAVAIVLLHSYANPDHERLLAGALAALGVPVTASSELLPEYREYERTTTTVANAYVAPVMEGYLGRLERSAHARRVRIMGSGGGALSVTRARREPAHTILSGPAGGVAGALHVARRHGLRDIMTFDMGGTSTDVSLCPGEALHTREFTIGGLPLALQVLDIHTVGAGGGSIARVDAGGALRVGPESAGAWPGPACYGRGGTQLTVSDANAVLGRLVPRSSLPLDVDAVAEPLQRLAADLGATPEEAAEGVVAVVNASMEGALRVISVERGHDPAGFTLVPFGGAAGLHAVALAERLEIPRLLVPPAPGVLSAWGMLVAPVRHDAARSVLETDPDPAVLEPVFAELRSAALAGLAEEADPADIEVRQWVAARYRGQSHELVVPAADWQRQFHAAHEQRFGYAMPAAVVEAVTLRVEALAPGNALPVPVLSRAGSSAGNAADAAKAQAARVVYDGVRLDALRYERERLLHGHELAGPALVLEETAAFWLPPGWRAAVAADGSLIVERG
jgi:N-methylhydantoinase A